MLYISNWSEAEAHMTGFILLPFAIFILSKGFENIKHADSIMAVVLTYLVFGGQMTNFPQNNPQNLLGIIGGSVVLSFVAQKYKPAGFAIIGGATGLLTMMFWIQIHLDFNHTRVTGYIFIAVGAAIGLFFKEKMNLIFCLLAGTGMAALGLMMVISGKDYDEDANADKSLFIFEGAVAAAGFYQSVRRKNSKSPTEAEAQLNNQTGNANQTSSQNTTSPTIAPQARSGPVHAGFVQVPIMPQQVYQPAPMYTTPMVQPIYYPTAQQFMVARPQIAFAQPQPQPVVQQPVTSPQKVSHPTSQHQSHQNMLSQINAHAPNKEYEF